MANLERITESSLPSSYVDGEDVTHLDFNKIIATLRAGSNANFSDIQDIWNGVKASGNSLKLSDAILSKLSTTILLNDDSKIPTAAQVFNAINTLSTNTGTVINTVKGCAKSFKIIDDVDCAANVVQNICMGEIIGGFGTTIVLDNNSNIKLNGSNTTMEMFIQLGFNTTVDTGATVSVTKNDVTIYTVDVKLIGINPVVNVKVPYINFSTNDIIKVKVNPNIACTVTLNNSHIDARILG